MNDDRYSTASSFDIGPGLESSSDIYPNIKINLLIYGAKNFSE